MKVTIKQSVLIEALAKGGMAALSDTAQTDTSNLSLIIQSVKISATDKFTVESLSSMMSSKFSVDAKIENGIDIQEVGTILIPAKEFVNWTKIQGQGNDSTISMVLSELPTPEIINPLDDVSDDDVGRFAIKKIGSVKFASKDAAKTSGKWELDSYDPDHYKSVNFKDKGTKHFEIKAEHFTDALSRISFASVKSDWEHYLDNISVQAYKDNLYFLTTDTKRCALFKLTTVNGVECPDPLLIPIPLLDQIAKHSNKENSLSFYYNGTEDKVYVSQANFEVRIVSADKDFVTKFPSIKMLLDKKYTLLGDITKAALNKILVSASLVNASSALFSFKEDKNIIAIKAISEDNKYKPHVSTAKASNLERDAKVIWGVTHLIQGLNSLNDDIVKLYIPTTDLGSVKLTGAQEDSFSYFAMSVTNPKYDTN